MKSGRGSRNSLMFPKLYSWKQSSTYTIKSTAKQHRRNQVLHGSQLSAWYYDKTNRSGMHGLNEELRRHRGREGRKSAHCVMQILRMLVHCMCCGIVLFRSAFM